MKRCVVLALAVVAATGAAPVRAEGNSPADAGSSKLAEAERRFHRGIDLYKDGDLAAALVEFKRAYELMPSFKILYNLGQVSYQRRDYAMALRYFRQYLDDGGDGVPAERRREVAAAIVDLEPHVGRLDLQTADDGAELFVDDVLIGTSPLRSLVAVNAGRRKVDIVARNGEHRTRLVEVPGGEIATVMIPRLGPRTADAAPARAADAPARTADAPAPAAAPPPRKPEPVAVFAAPVPAFVAPPAAGVTSPSTDAVPVAVAKPVRKASFPWKSWTLTGLLAGGAATTGVIALQSKHNLDGSLNAFPQSQTDIDYYQRRTRGFAMATDGLMIGTAIMAAISLYLTFRDPG
jgi:hypothetical protein